MLTALPRLRDRVYADFLMRSRLAEYERLLESPSGGLPEQLRGSFWRRAEGKGLDAAERSSCCATTSTRIADGRGDVAIDPGSASRAPTSSGSPPGAAPHGRDRRRRERGEYHTRSSLGRQAPGPAQPARGPPTVARRGPLRRQHPSAAATTGLPMRVVAAHGIREPPARRRELGALADPAFRRRSHELETYDSVPRAAPAPLHGRVAPATRAPGICGGDRCRRAVISILVHPRHCAPIGRERTRCGRRIAEGIRFALPVATRRRR